MSELNQGTPKTGRRLIFQDGTTIEDGTAGYSAGFLWLHMPGYSMIQAAQLCFDTTKTAHIVFEYGEMTDDYSGFTNCTNLSVDMDGTASACLQKEVQNV